MREKLIELAQQYLGMNPSDKGCLDYDEMQHKMADEILDIVKVKEKSSDKEYLVSYIVKDKKMGLNGIFNARLIDDQNFSGYELWKFIEREIERIEEGGRFRVIAINNLNT